ncbi:TKFC [Branchiostoma lanceolatum]|uniref:Triokinase/FMN cyclase n=1 Tax=Branchiostoma lanceolatum TaxID=7740 RepID=A0A8K0EN53_BRALA|nr:TKFC [Branchiostoma lanceolatum]
MAKVTKKLLDSVETCVDDMLEGLVAVNPGLRLLAGHHVVLREDWEDVRANKVAVVSGGGSGHEPGYHGFVGSGLLTAAVPGNIFASPPPDDVQAALKAVTGPAGVIVLVTNYTGDRLTFGIAVERARAEGLQVEMVCIGEDCAVSSKDKTAGRRGLAGTVFVQKIAGALSEEGKSLGEIVDAVKSAISSMGTMGVCLSPCSVPGSGPMFQVPHDTIELGLGVHGEAGVGKMKMDTAEKVVETVLNHMTNPDNTSRIEVNKGDSVALLVNNLGSTAYLELYIIARDAIKYLEARGVSVERTYVGPFVTSQEMAGMSLTLLRLDDTRRRCLDAPTTAHGWFPVCPSPSTGTLRTTRTRVQLSTDTQQAATITADATKVDKDTAQQIFHVVSAVCNSLMTAEEQLNDLDRACGDGDCGSTLAKGAKAILSALGSADTPGLPCQTPAVLLQEMATIVEKSMGGASGGLYSLFLTAGAQSVMTSVTPASWTAALKAGVASIIRYGGANPGDRTMLDPLHSASEVLQALQGETADTMATLKEAVEAAENSAQRTASMAARAGRASYVSTDRLTRPDPGAQAVAIWMRAIYSTLEK